jgi:uncharacterized protein (TIGR02453 family)
MPAPSGFSPATLKFLHDLEKSNKKAWFDAHRAAYENDLIEPAKEFVIDLGQKLQKLDPTVQFTPKINGSIRRINRDIRFSADKSPYKNHLDLHFPAGEGRMCGTSSFMMRLQPKGVVLVTGSYLFSKPSLKRYREVLRDAKQAAALERALKKVEQAGFELGGRNYKRVPKGFSTDPRYEPFLLHDGLHVFKDVGIPKEFGSAKFAGYCAAEFRKTLPLHQWLTDCLTG